MSGRVRPAVGTTGYALFLGITAAAWGQPALLFQDDFDRGWENGQTNSALPAWSEPGGGFVPPTDGTPIAVDVEVDGTNFRVLINNQQFIDMSDANLGPGSVGLTAWYERGDAGSLRWGVRCETLSVLDSAQQSLLQEDWQLPPEVPATWTTPVPKQADGTDPALISTWSPGSFRWDFNAAAIVEDSNTYTWATAAAPNTDFYGPTIAYTGAGSDAWTDYRVRTRIFEKDDDGPGLIVRYREDANSLSFYRITFAAQATGTTVQRAPQGVSVQKCVYDKVGGTAQWSSVLVDTSFVYTPSTPFDVTVTVQNIAGPQAEILIDIVDDPAGVATVVPTIVATDATAPLTAGSVGLHAWGSEHTRFSSHGGVSTPLVTELDDTTVLLGDIFSQGYNNWLSPSTPQTEAVNPPAWGIHLLTQDVMEASDGRQGTSGAAADGQYQPYIMFKDGFNSGTTYTLSTTLRTYDNDGFGLVFGYQDDSNYFRVGLRAQASNLGFPQGVSVDKVVGGVITQLAVVAIQPPRSNFAGIWMKKFRSSTIEMSDNAHLYDASGQAGVEFQGPRLVRGNVAWEDYTWEAVIEAQDDDGIGLIFRFQDENNFYRLTFQDQDQARPDAPPAGLSVQKVAGGVWTELFRDTDPTAGGDNDVNAAAGFKYDSDGLLAGAASEGFRIWRTRVICTAGTFRIEIDGISEIDGTEYPNFYQATVVDPAPLESGKVGLHTWGHNANEFRDIKLTLAGQGTPEFEDATGDPDPKGWIDATEATMSDPASVSNAETAFGAVGAGTAFSGIGIRADLNALGIRDNRYISGTDYIVPGDPPDYTRGTTNFDGPRGVAGETNWTDYTYDVELKALDNDGIGILFRYQNESNFYRLMFMSQAGNTLGAPPQGVSVQKRLTGTYEEVFYSNEFIYTPGERWHVQVTCQGADFTINITQLDGDVDGDTQTSYEFMFTDAADPLLAGKIGVTVWGEKEQANEVNTLLGGAGLDWTQHFSEGAVFDNVEVNGVAGAAPPDLNNDGKINETDLLLWEGCDTGPEVPLPDPSDPVCRKADQDQDLDVDSADYAVFQRCISGDDPLDPTCIE